MEDLSSVAATPDFSWFRSSCKTIMKKGMTIDNGVAWVMVPMCCNLICVKFAVGFSLCRLSHVFIHFFVYINILLEYSSWVLKYHFSVAFVLKISHCRMQMMESFQSFCTRIWTVQHCVRTFYRSAILKTCPGKEIYIETWLKSHSAC